MDIDKQKKIKEAMAHLSELREKVNEDYKRLEQSIELQALCPDAFEHGSCSSSWIVNDEKPMFQIKKGNGETVTFEFAAVSDAIKLDEVARRKITWRDSYLRHKNNKINNALYRFVQGEEKKENRKVTI
jgi:hypothetical protein